MSDDNSDYISENTVKESDEDKFNSTGNKSSYGDSQDNDYDGEDNSNFHDHCSSEHLDNENNHTNMLNIVIYD